MSQAVVACQRLVLKSFRNQLLPGAICEPSLCAPERTRGPSVRVFDKRHVIVLKKGTHCSASSVSEAEIAEGREESTDEVEPIENGVGLDIGTLKKVVERDKDAGITLLHEAVVAADGDTTLVERLLDAGADINGRDRSVLQTGETPLHVAAHMGDLELVDFLIKRGAYVEARDWLGRSPLCSCLVGTADIQVAKRLTKAGARTTFRSKQTGMMPLHFAVHKGSFCSYELVEYLIKRRAPLDQRDYAYNTPLHYAIEHDDPDDEGYHFFDLLLSYNADIGIKRRDGKTVLHLAVLQSNPERVEMCLKRGARIDVRDWNQMTPLDYARSIKKKGSLDVQMLLMKPRNRNLPKKIDVDED